MKEIKSLTQDFKLEGMCNAHAFSLCSFFVANSMRLQYSYAGKIFFTKKGNQKLYFYYYTVKNKSILGFLRHIT
jgi:hypothetical protein